MENQGYTVITHSGRAHLDEILAISVLAACRNELPEDIRRLSSEESAALVAAGEIPENAWVIDCGLEFDPDRRLFDHHQDRELPSAALMMFRHCFPELEDTDLGSFFNLASKVDTGGMRALDDFENLGESRDYLGFAQNILTIVFEMRPLFIAEIVTRGIEDKIRFEEVKKAAAEWVAVPGRLVDRDIDGVKVLEYTRQPPVDIVDGLKSIDRAVIEEHQAAVVYGYDKKDAGIRTLYRTDIGHDLVDFTRATIGDALFCHQGGFLARFRPTDDDEWKRLITESRLQQPG